METVCVAVMVPTGNTMAHRIQSSVRASVAARIPHRAVRHMEDDATRRTAHTILEATFGAVAGIMVARISAHTWLLLFIAAPVRACPPTAVNASCRVVTRVIHPIWVHTCRQVLALVLNQVLRQVFGGVAARM